MSGAATRTDTEAPRRYRRFPALPLYGAFAMVGFTMAAAIFAQTTGIGTVKMDLGEPAAIRDIVLTGGEGEHVRVIDAASGALLADFAEGEGGFVRGALRGLNRMRQTADIPVTHPYRLIKWQGGAVSLSDTGTGQRLYLQAFGPDNVAAFEALLNAPKRQGG